MSNATTRSAQTEADKAKQSAGQAASNVGQAASHAGQAGQDLVHAAGQKVQEAAHTAGQKVQEAAHTAGQKAQDVAHAAGQKAQDVAQTAGQKAQDATAAFGRTLETAADKVRSNTPNEGVIGRASEAVASSLEKGGRYLEDKNLTGLADDMTEMIRRNPIPAVLIGVGLGFLIGRTLRS
jgi:vacuolar-type H+-ATPase subunit H